MMKYNSKIFARSICAVMAGIMMVGGLTGCGNDDAVDGRGMRLEKQNGDKTEITGIAEKYREKESKQKKKSLQDNGLSGIFNSTSNDVMYAEEACDVATVAARVIIVLLCVSVTARVSCGETSAFGDDLVFKYG